MTSDGMIEHTARMTTYIHGYGERETRRLQDQAATLVELLHGDTRFPPDAQVLEAGCGVGAQTIILAEHSPDAVIESIDVSAKSLELAKARVEAAGHRNMRAAAPPLGQKRLEGTRTVRFAERSVARFGKQTPRQIAELEWVVSGPLDRSRSAPIGGYALGRANGRTNEVSARSGDVGQTEASGRSARSFVRVFRQDVRTRMTAGTVDATDPYVRPLCRRLVLCH